jgi:hypothetical protein
VLLARPGAGVNALNLPSVIVLSKLYMFQRSSFVFALSRGLLLMHPRQLRLLLMWCVCGATGVPVAPTKAA